jgi:hypothetical protein
MEGLPVSGITLRSESRRRIEEVVGRAVGGVIPADEAVGLRGRTFCDFEDQIYAAGRTMMTAMFQERLALDLAAWQESGGHCPHCGSERVYLEKELFRREVLSPVGPLTLQIQQCRCRACDGSFSPTDSGLGAAR